MEQLPARDASGIQASIDMVDQADIYIGIYAWRYGWVPDGSDISITEMELNAALRPMRAGPAGDKPPARSADKPLCRRSTEGGLAPW